MNNPARHRALPPAGGPCSRWAPRGSIVAVAGQGGTDHAGRLGAGAAGQIGQALLTRGQRWAVGAGTTDAIAVCAGAGAFDGVTARPALSGGIPLQTRRSFVTLLQAIVTVRLAAFHPRDTDRPRC